MSDYEFICESSSGIMNHNHFESALASYRWRAARYITLHCNSVIQRQLIMLTFNIFNGLSAQRLQTKRAQVTLCVFIAAAAAAGLLVENNTC